MSVKENIMFKFDRADRPDGETQKTRQYGILPQISSYTFGGQQQRTL